MNPSTQELARAIADQLAATISAMTGVEVDASVPAAAPIAGYVARVGPANGESTWQITFDRSGAAGLARLVLGSESDPAPESIREALSQLCTRVADALTALPVAGGVNWRLHELHERPEAVTTATLAVAIQVQSLMVPLVIGLAAPSQVADKSIMADPAAQPDPARDHLDRILDIELPVIVRFGRSELPLRTLSRLGPGSLIDLGRSPDDPVDLLVSNRVVARGEVVVVGGNYGIRILDVIDPRDRVHSLES
jgi:flagellar motor switch protein FliN